MRMQRLLAFPLASLFLLSGIAVVAQDEQSTAPPAGTVHIEQVSNMGAVGIWTILKPNHESVERSDAKLVVPDLIPGRYSVFAKPPEGTTANIKVFLGDDVIVTSDTPQISFELKDKMTLNVVITYTLTIFGKISVGSDPIGVPFELKGPNAMVRTGITPTEISPVPIGNYSVTFQPKGCNNPPTQGGLLEKEGRVNFMVRIVCDTFEPVITAEKPTVITADVGETSIAFHDIPSDTWFAPYVMTVVKRGIMAGYTDAKGTLSGFFGPGDPVTVAQLAKIAHGLVKLDENLVKTAPLNPAGRGQWFTRYLASAEENGWLLYVNGTVDPHRPATRAEVVATLLQILEIPMQWAKGTAFTDVRKSTPYAHAVETAAAEGIVGGSTGADGKPTGLFHPGDPITRGEIAKVAITVYEKYLKEPMPDS